MDTLERVRKIIVGNLKIDESKVVENATFKDDLSMDSLAQAELIMEFEKEFGIELHLLKNSYYNYIYKNQNCHKFY